MAKNKVHISPGTASRNTIHDIKNPEQYKELGEYIDSLDKSERSLIGILHHAQGLYGFLSRDTQLYVARKLNIPGAEVFGVVSFYSYFSMKPPGKHTVSICMGTACYVRGADVILGCFEEELGVRASQTSEDGRFTLKDVRCVGACGLAPVVTVGEKVFGRVQKEDVARIVNEYRGK